MSGIRSNHRPCSAAQLGYPCTMAATTPEQERPLCAKHAAAQGGGGRAFVFRQAGSRNFGVFVDGVLVEGGFFDRGAADDVAWSLNRAKAVQ